ncbi:MAG: succinate dehydrogenase/fumarate reductase iron-sulfur subunit [Cyclobacteriaceae bacterium]|nr:succinate dehydrogenase/fumarate reductase iron-sulfur subunit [Cyclobacteriaceae bacterium]
MKLKLKIWRQKNNTTKGAFKNYEIDNVSSDTSFLEMLDQLNVELEERGEEPVHFDHDCREGICGTCSLYINGQPHGPHQTTTCQLHMRSFQDGDSITIEPWRAQAFPVIKDLVVDRSAFDRIIQAGGYISANTGGIPDANAILIPKPLASEAMDAAACIGCGACVAACKNASAMLFVSAKIAHLGKLPQGQVERYERAEKMVAKMDEEGFGACTNTGACAAECPKEISLTNIAMLNRDYMKASFTS